MKENYRSQEAGLKPKIENEELETGRPSWLLLFRILFVQLFLLFVQGSQITLKKIHLISNWA